MWIGRDVYNTLNELINSAQNQRTQKMIENAALQQKVLDLERMNTRLQGDLDWSKHRLNQVEKERAQLIAAAIGVKVSYPEFMPRTENPNEALTQIPDLSTIGNDARDDEATKAFIETTEGTVGVVSDFSMIPGYREQE